MARTTPIEVASIVAAVAVASAVAAWVTFRSVEQSPKDQESFFGARFPNLAVLQSPAGIPFPSAIDIKLHAAKDLLAQKLRDGGWNASEPAESPTRIAATVPLPKPRPASANLGPQQSEVTQSDERTLLQRLADLFRPRMTLASMTPEDGLSGGMPDFASLGYDGVTAVYDISARTVYLPNGLRLEAHSGFGDTKDDPRHVTQRDVGATPPAVYDLKLRERPFHGVHALRMIPVEGNTLGRSGLLAHGYMLGPEGDSNGCVSIRDYERFLAAFQRGEIKRLIVVSSVADLARQPLKS